MLDDLKWEVALLATVQGFYERALGDHLGASIPVPEALTADAIGQSTDIRSVLTQLSTWIELLNMATTPGTLRSGMGPDLDPESAEALLRYLVRRRDGSSDNRDKTDLVATFLYRHPRVPGQWEKTGYGLDGSLPLSPFEIALIEILADSDTPPLPEDCVQVLRQFGPLLDDVRQFKDLNSLLDSGIITRVRTLKASLGDSIYHPGVLATIAPYNVTVGDCLAPLLEESIQRIKAFAQKLEELGGDILATIDGVEVTVAHVSALNTDAIRKNEYSIGLEKIRRIAKLRKELERRPPIRRTQTPWPSATRSAAGASAGAAAAVAPAIAPKYVASAITPQALSIEEAKLRRVEESISIFVRVADPKFRQIVPMRFFNLTLDPAEIDAYTAAYLNETSPRADVARMLLRIVSMTARIITETEELKRSQTSASIWKLHADSLTVLVELAKRVSQAVTQLKVIAQQENLPGQGEALQQSLDKLRRRAEEAANILAVSQ